MTAAFFDFTLNDGRVEAAIGTSCDDAATAMGEHVLAVSNQHVPHELGELELSGVVSEPEDGEVWISYGTPYAIVQHEDLTFQHDEGRTAKYLENALNSEAQTCEEIAARVMGL